MRDRKFDNAYPADEVRPPSPRSTGLVFAAVAVIVAALWRSNPSIAVPFLGLGCALVLVSVTAPNLLQPLNRVWFRLGLVLHKVVNPVVMFVLFAVVIVPAGLLMRLFHDPLVLRANKQAKSYWIDCKSEEASKTSMRNQF